MSAPSTTHQVAAAPHPSMTTPPVHYLVPPPSHRNLSNNPATNFSILEILIKLVACVDNVLGFLYCMGFFIYLQTNEKFISELLLRDVIINFTRGRSREDQFTYSELCVYYCIVASWLISYWLLTRKLADSVKNRESTWSLIWACLSIGALIISLIFNVPFVIVSFTKPKDYEFKYFQSCIIFHFVIWGIQWCLKIGQLLAVFMFRKRFSQMKANNNAHVELEASGHVEQVKSQLPNDGMSVGPPS